ncbi:MAG: hypothetical protein AAF570_20975 [Bacteroidota bacterium]
MILAVLPIANIYAYNYRAFQANMEGVDHARSMEQPVGGGNCMNWVIGHVLVARDQVLTTLGLPTVCDPAMAEIYGREGMKVSEKFRNLGTLLMLFEGSQEMIQTGLDGLEETKPGLEAILRQVSGLAFHEAYHLGQLGSIRRVLGMEGAIR